MRLFLLSVLYLFVLSISSIYAQRDGGMLCGGEDEIPIWILRFEVVDAETHSPIQGAEIRIRNLNDRGMTWHVNRSGVGILIVTQPQCIPGIGSIEIRAPKYEYVKYDIEQDYFFSNNSKKRIYLEGHRHNWTSGDEVPETSEIIDKITRNRYEVGVHDINTGLGFSMPNYAPGCFEYEIEMHYLDRGSDDNRYSNRQKRNNTDHNSNRNSILEYQGQTIYLFPNDLSGSNYYWSKAISNCNNLNRLGYDDWYLPNKDELFYIYENSERIGMQESGWYWSSSESSNGKRGWGVDFSSGIVETENKSSSYNVHYGPRKVRCIRKD
jgi:hypothetical protein